MVWLGCFPPTDKKHATAKKVVALVPARGHIIHSTPPGAGRAASKIARGKLESCGVRDANPLFILIHHKEMMKHG